MDYYWHEHEITQPEDEREDLTITEDNPRRKAFTAKKSAFTLDKGFGQCFLQWLTISCGTGESLENHKRRHCRLKKKEIFMKALGNTTNRGTTKVHFFFRRSNPR